jgi:nucleotide-binding universal stress UspA family protein
MLPRDLGEQAIRLCEETHPVVVGVDGSAAALRAARWASAVAKLLSAPLLIVHAGPSLGHNPTDAIAQLKAGAIAAQRESAVSILDSAEHAVRAQSKALHVMRADMTAPAEEVLVELSQAARMIVVGSDEVSLGSAILLGSTTTIVATNSACPVVAWRGDAVTPTTRPIVVGVGVDGDRDSQLAISTAFDTAHRLGVGVIAVHAWSTRRGPVVVTLPSIIDWKEVESVERKRLSEMLAPWRQHYPDVDVDCVVEMEKPSRALLRHVKGAQLVVVGSRGRGLFAGTVLGSTGLNLLHHSPIPVMICRPVEGNGSPIENQQTADGRTDQPRSDT